MIIRSSAVLAPLTLMILPSAHAQSVTVWDDVSETRDQVKLTVDFSDFF